MPRHKRGEKSRIVIQLINSVLQGLICQAVNSWLHSSESNAAKILENLDEISS